MKNTLIFTIGHLLFLAVACTSPTEKPTPIDAQEVLDRCFEFHDPTDQWPSWAGVYTSVEPRLRVPERRTYVQVRADGTFFDMKRAYGKDTLHWVIQQGQYTTFVNGEMVQDSAMIKAHRLSQGRTDNYHNYYRTKLGLPVSLKGRYQLKQEQAKRMDWRGRAAYRLELEIADAPFSTAWELFVDSKDYRLLGYGFFPADGEGEYLIVDHLMEIGQMRLPRMRHWYSRGEDEYLGSDIILKVSPMHD